MPFSACYSKGHVKVRKKDFEFDKWQSKRCLSGVVWAQESGGVICFAKRRLEPAKKKK